MHKMTSEFEIKEKIKHDFYCDRCGKYLGRSIELDDCYYDDIGEFHMSYYIENDGWYKIKQHLCDDCKQNFVEKVKNVFKMLGFEKEK